MKTKIFLIALLLATTLSLSALAQSEPQSASIQSTNNSGGQSAQSPRKTPSEQSGQTVTTTAQPSPPMLPGQVGKVIQVRHRDPKELAEALRGLTNAFLNPNYEFKTITVRGRAEEVKAVEDAILSLDRPAGETISSSRKGPVNFEVQLYLLATSKNSTDKATLPGGLEPVVTQLQDTLKYKGYRLITTILNRTEAGAKVEGNGATDALFPLPADSGKSFYSYSLNGFMISTDEAGKEWIRLGRFYFGVKTPLDLVVDGKSTRQYQDAGVNTSLSLRDGEKVVVGTANLGLSDEAIIVVVSVKKIK